MVKQLDAAAPNDQPQARSMRDPVVRSLRMDMLQLPHIAPLTQYAATLRAMERGSVPTFDPLDGGVDARMLFLLEKPGPMTDSGRGDRYGSGFISRDNDDPSAEALSRFMHLAQIPRSETVLWNVIPWWNGTVKVTAPELQRGLGALDELISLLPKLKVVVLVGHKAARAKGHVGAKGLEVVLSAHPSARVRASYPHLWNQIPVRWAEARKLLP